MILGPYKLLLQILAAAMIGVTLLIGAALWVLSAGPINLAFATPYIERALTSPDSPNVVRVRETVIAWDRAQDSIKVRALGIRIFDRERAQMVATAPSVTVRFSISALLRGLLAPSVLEIEGATLRVRRQPDGTLRLGFTSDDGQSDIAGEVTGLLAGLIQPPDPGSPAGYLHTIGVVDATIRVDDQVNDVQWIARNAEVRLRRDDQAIKAEMTARLDVNGLSADLAVTGSFDLDRRTTELAVSFEGLQPAALAALERHARELSRIEMPIDGTVALRIDARGEIASADFELIGGPGVVDIPELYDEPLSVDAVFVKGQVADHFDRLTIEDAFVDIDGVTASLRGILVRESDDRLVLNAEAEASDVPIDRLEKLWPSSLQAPARRWIVRNLEDGTADTAEIRLRAEATAGDTFSIDAIDVAGGITFSGMTVHYLRPMTPVTDAIGNARFDNTRLSLSVTSGVAQELVVEAAQIELIELDTDDPIADISLTVAGSAEAALALLDQEPLHFIRTLGIDPGSVAGQQRTNAAFRFPLIRDLAADQVDATAAARISGFSYDKGILGLPIADGELTLEVDRDQLRVTGNVDLAGTPFEAVWTRSLNSDTPFQEQFQLRGTVDDAGRARLGVALPDWISGQIGVGLTYTTSGSGDGFGAAEVDLTAARIELSPFAWRKENGTEAGGRFDFSVESGAITGSPSFEFSAPSLLVEGALNFASDGSFGIRDASFARLRVGDTDVSGTFSVEDGQYEIGLAGANLDLRPFLSIGDAAADGEPGTPFTVTILDGGLDQVRLNEDLYLTDVVGDLTHDGDVVRAADITAALPGSGPFSVNVAGRPDGRDVALRTADAGAFLRALGWVDAMRGGNLELEASIDDNVPGRPAFGVARIEDFEIVQSSVLARLLTLASFQGIQDVLEGNGIRFSQLEVPFRLTEEAVDVKNVRARGSALGILAEGRIDRLDGTIDMAGEVAPAYILNSLLGNIPVLGDVLTGGGPGIFAATYKVHGSLQDPIVTVNPLSVLTPGFTRRILSGFEGGLGSGKKTDYVIDTPGEDN